jgi:hypothetical protein
LTYSNIRIYEFYIGGKPCAKFFKTNNNENSSNAH